ncbi:EG45-like domain containing protein [Silene latifolia]|uniref:EG45-like domain containing protein n=1 Tax=Silene latifolia TaxID=37657 RepID=UPI003D77C9D1
MNTFTISKLNYSLVFFLEIARTCYADIGTATQYSSPYIPTECYGDDTTNFPANNFFAAAGDGIWDNGAACGRQYVIQCISVANPFSCLNQGSTIQVKIVDYANTAVSRPVITSGTTVYLSDVAFKALVNDSSESTTTAAAPSINIVLIQVD